MQETIYFDEDDKPRLLESYCVFADFLGYRHEIRKAASEGNEAAVFHRFMTEIEPVIESVINPHRDDDVPGFARIWDAKVFTDCVVLGYAIGPNGGESEFGHALTQLLEFQYAVALKELFVRGGWAAGNLFMNRNTVYGTALLDAYDLESEAANYPRVILSDDMKDRVFRHMARHAEYPPQCHHLLVSGDGHLFTNYLSEAIIDGEVMWNDLLRHATIIRKRLAEHAENSHVLPKYQWLASYHNFFCGLVSSSDGYTEGVKVEVGFPDFGIRQLSHDESPYVAKLAAERQNWQTKLAKLKKDSGGG